MKKRIAIVGGGISGLTAAYILHRDDSESCEFTLFEGEKRAGGIIETVHMDGFTIECGPDSWVTEKPWAEQLARELGLGDQLLGSNDHARRTYIARGGSLTPLPEAMRMMVPADLSTVLASPLFTDAAKQAYMTEPSRAAQLREDALANRTADSDESVAAFVRRHFGDEVIETVAGPLLAGIFGGDIERLSARALLGPFVAMESAYGSLIVGLQQRSRASEAPVFTTLAGGLNTLVARLMEILPPASLQLSSPVLKLDIQPVGWAVKTPNGGEQFDRVLLATPLDATRQLLTSLPCKEAQQAATLLPTDAASGLVVAFGYGTQAKPTPTIPDGFGLLVAAGPQNHHSLLACTFLDQKFSGRAPEGSALLRAFFASSAADELARRSDTEIAAIARSQLTALLGPLPEHADVTIVRRWPRSLPQYEVGHVARMTQFDHCLSGLQGIAVAGNALRGVGLPDLVRDATKAAHLLARD
ncbi:MAG TPA: protoporphyrinogen oxidase [Acidobacteriaceae bacterium]|nr:protoporphyrinogen oxidase [Acidobacteriaceae bacterium]